MHPLAAALVLLSAAAHVYWNLQVKRSPEPALYGCLLIGIGAVAFLPVALYLAWPPRVPPAGWACVTATGLVYAAYYAMIGQSYRRDDLSRAYPIARGIAPAATAVLGVTFFAERPSAWGWAGIIGIALGVLALGAPDLLRQQGKLPWAGITAAVATGLCTAAYSAIDKEGVRHVHPALYVVLTSLAGSLAYGAVVWRRLGWRPLQSEAQRGGVALGLAALAAVGSYLLVLYVLQSSPVSYVVPLRSVAVLLSVLAGTRLLGETGGPARLAAAGLILFGITAIAVGG